MGRFVLTDSPVLAPAACRCCGSATKTPFVDMGYLEEWHGNVYYCKECIGEVANLLGYISPKNATNLINENDTLTKRNEVLTQLNIELEHITGSLERAGYAKLQPGTTISIDGSGTIISSPNRSFETSNQQLSSNVGQSSESDPRITEQQQGNAQPPNEQKLGAVFTDSIRKSRLPTI